MLVFSKRNKWIIVLIISMLLFSMNIAAVPAFAQDEQEALQDEAPPQSLNSVITSAAAAVNEKQGDRRPLVFSNHILRGNSASHEAFIEIGKGQQVGAGSYIELYFSHSTALLPEFSTLSVLINDIPFASYTLDWETETPQRIVMDLSQQKLGPGYHKITLVASMRLTYDACENPQHPDLWSIIHESSSIMLQLAPVYEQADLSWYPSPFVERGSEYPLHAILVVPDQIEQAEFNAAARLSQFFASQTSNGKLFIPIFTESELSPSQLNSEQVIWIGHVDRWQQLGKLAVEAAEDVSELSGSSEYGNIIEFASPWNQAKTHLLVTGNDKQLVTAATILSTEQLYDQLLDHSVLVPDELPHTEQEDANVSEQPYIVSFEQLGYEHLKVENVLMGSTSMQYTIPVAIDVDKGSKLRLAYSHSNAIIHGKSVMTVKINGIPVESVGLTKRTSQGATIEIPIDPVVVGSSRTVNLEFGFQFANAAAREDVDREFNCVDTLLGDWAVIDYSSQLVIVPSERQAEYLQYLPYPFITNGEWDSTVFLMPDTESQSLQLAMTLIGRMGNERPDLSKLQVVHRLTDALSEQLKDSHIIFAGTANQLPATFNPFEGSYVHFTENHISSLSEKVPLLPTLQQQFAVTQLTRSPYNDEKRLMLLVAENAERLPALGQAFIDPEESLKISARFFAIDRMGEVHSFPETMDPISHQLVELTSGNERWEDFEVSGRTFIILFLLVLGTMIFFAIWLNQRVKK